MNSNLENKLNEIKSAFCINDSNLVKISDAFYRDMTDKTRLKMFRSFITAPSNISFNEYLAIDLGGSNMRISKFEISKEAIVLKDCLKIPLRTIEWDYTTDKYSLKDLFIMILKKSIDFLDKERTYFLGLTISFGLDSEAKDRAKIAELSKGFKLHDTLGEDIYIIACEAINELGLKIIPTTIINDVVATLVTGSFYNKNSDIAMIIGTGHNSSFISNSDEIINVESADFNINIPLTEFDEKYLVKNPKVSAKILEVMVGGKYIGEIAKEIVNELVKDGVVEEIHTVSTKVLVDALKGNLVNIYSEEQIEVLKSVAKILFDRAVRLIVAETAGIIKFIDSDFNNSHTIVFDGSVYEKCEYFRNKLSSEIINFFGDNASKVSHTLIKDASGMGAAISAANKK